LQRGGRCGALARAAARLAAGALAAGALLGTGAACAAAATLHVNGAGGSDVGNCKASACRRRR
jgi:hypothetical protein